MALTDQHNLFLEKIVTSKEFRSSEIYKNLLTYLYNCHREQKPVKEATIAIEFFNKTASFNPAEESSIRFHMYKLRKKLAAYYASEGSEDKIIIEIPKGHYDLVISPRNKQQPKRKGNTFNKFLFTSTILLFFTVITLVVLLIKSPKVNDAIPRNSEFWAPVFSNDLPVNLIFGDFYVFEEYDPARGLHRRVMDYYINNKYDFENFGIQYPQKRVKQFELGELPHNSIFNLQDLTHVFNSYQRDYNILLTRSMAANDIINHNNIYVGNFTNMRHLRDLISLLPAYVHPLRDHRRIIDVYSSKADSFLTFKTETLWQNDTYKLDFGILARLPGINNEEFIIMSGFSYITLIHFTNSTSDNNKLEKMINELYDFAQIDALPPYFSAVYEVAGYGYTDYTSKLKLFNVVDKDEFQDAYRRLISKTEN